MRVQETPPAAAAVGLGEVRDYLRIDGAAEDALLAGLVRTATTLCEAFTGLALIERAVSELLPANGQWQTLRRAPVQAIDGVDRLAPDGSGVPLAADAWAAELGADGQARVRVSGQPAGTRARVRYRAGLGSDWNAVPEPLRQGIIRLVAHLYTHRDAAEAGAPPAAVTALWRPWRQARLV
jgi:uncharacterized phiE125 gp8 family phage protein